MSEDTFTEQDAQALVDFDKYCAEAEEAVSKLAEAAGKTGRHFFTLIAMKACGHLFVARSEVGLILMHLQGKLALAVEVQSNPEAEGSLPHSDRDE
jgi:geranylgeranyl pyrophosphate synthase